MEKESITIRTHNNTIVLVAPNFGTDFNSKTKYNVLEFNLKLAYKGGMGSYDTEREARRAAARRKKVLDKFAAEDRKNALRHNRVRQHRNCKRLQQLTPHIPQIIQDWYNHRYGGPIGYLDHSHKPGKLDLRQDSLHDPNCDPILVWSSPTKQHDYYPMIIRIKDNYHLFPYVGTKNNWLSSELRINLTNTIDITDRIHQLQT